MTRGRPRSSYPCAVLLATASFIACSGDHADAITNVRDATDGECPSGGVVLETGVDRDSDGVLSAEEVVEASPVCNGEDGANALIRTSPEPAGANCPGGGLRIDAGIDADHDGELSPEESDSTEFVCEARATLVSTTAISNEGPCTANGLRFDSGLDVDGDLVLDDAEISSTRFVCDGAGADVVLVRIDELDPDSPCATGGRNLHTGIDDNGDGVLADTEIDQTTTLCDADYAVLVDATEEPVGVRCPAGGTRIRHGLDVDRDGILADIEVAAGDTAYVCNGVDAVRATFLATLRNEPPTTDQFFGGDVAQRGNVLVVKRSGVVNFSIYERADAAAPWNLVTILVPAGSSNWNGVGIAFAGNSLVIAAPFDNELGADRGALYVYDRNATWTLSQKILSPSAATSNFGSWLTADGDRIVASGGGNPNNVYVYDRPSGGGPFALSATLPQPSYASALALSGDVLAVGRNTHVAIYDRIPATNTWAQTAAITPEAAGYFTSDVALDGPTLVIGAAAAQVAGRTGVTYVFERSLAGAWNQAGALIPIVGLYGGTRVAVDSGTIAFTANTSEFGGGSNATFLAEYDTLAGWTISQKLISPDARNDDFGIAISLDSGELWVGAPRYTQEAATQAGAVHGFRLR